MAAGGGEVMNGTWTTKESPKTLQTALGTLLIVLIILVGLAYQSQHGGGASQTTNQPTAIPSPATTHRP
jgi:hypothetical protein